MNSDGDHDKGYLVAGIYNNIHEKYFSNIYFSKLKLENQRAKEMSTTLDPTGKKTLSMCAYNRHTAGMSALKIILQELCRSFAVWAKSNSDAGENQRLQLYELQTWSSQNCHSQSPKSYHVIWNAYLRNRAKRAFPFKLPGYFIYRVKFIFISQIFWKTLWLIPVLYICGLLLLFGRLLPFWLIGIPKEFQWKRDCYSASRSLHIQLNTFWEEEDRTRNLFPQIPLLCWTVCTDTAAETRWPKTGDIELLRLPTLLVTNIQLKKGIQQSSSTTML